MTREQEHAVRQQARQAANHDDDLGRARTKERAEWWVAELSYKLGIVDAQGMIDINGEIARAFTSAYLRAPREVWPTQDTTGTSSNFTKENIMATRKRQSAPKGRGGSSGGGNPRNSREISETQHDDAMRVLRAEYYQGVRSIAEALAQRVKDKDFGSASQDEWQDAIDQAVDGSYWVIYTHANFQVLMCSDNHDAYSEDFGEPPVSGNDINWAALAYAAMKRDVQQQIDAEGVEPDWSNMEERRRPLPSTSSPLDRKRRRAPARRR